MPVNKIFDFNKRNEKTNQIEKKGYMKFNSVSEEKAQLYFYGDIVSDSWESYWYEEDKCPQDILDFLQGLDEYKDLDIFINSGGGSVSAGLAIYNQLSRFKGHKVVHDDGLAASIAGVILMSGDEIIVPDTAQIMMHKPWSCICGNADDLRKEATALDNCQEAILNVYMKKAKEGITREEIENMVNAETWLTGTGAAEYFNIKVEKENNQQFNCISDYFNKYKNTPKALLKHDNEKEKKNKLLKDKLQVQLDLMNI